MKRYQKALSLALAMVLTTGILAGCSSGGAAQQQTPTTKAETKTPDAGTTEDETGAPEAVASVDTSKDANLVYYLWGGEGVANKDILAKINEKLKADINATLEIKYIDWGDISTKYPLLFASGEQFDMSHSSPGTSPSYYTLAAQDVLVDITDMLPTVAPVLQAEIPDDVWLGSRFNDKIYGVPTMYSEFTAHGIVQIRNLLEKYSMEPVDSIETLEQYWDNVLENESIAPLNGDVNEALNMYRMLIELSGTWIEAPGIPASGTNFYLAAPSIDKYNELFHPAFTQEYEEWAVKMKEWADKGYWPKDILSSQKGGKENFNNALSASFITHMPDWTGNYGGLKELQPDVETDFWCLPETTGKIRKKMGVENSTVISTTSKNPERALMALEKFMTDEEYYRLIQYGIEGRQYEIVDGLAVQPASFNADVDGGGFAVWSLRNDRFNIPYASEDPRRYTLIEEWKNIAIDNPYVGFNFDSTKVSTELSSIANVDSQLGVQIMLGKTPNDPREAVAEYRDQLQKAGIDTLINEVQTQMQGFEPIS